MTAPEVPLLRSLVLHRRLLALSNQSDPRCGSQISARPFIVQQRYIPLSGSSRFEFDPMKILIHSRYRFPRAMGKIWAFEDKYFDPNAPALPSAAPLMVLRNGA
jgi:hypothetical protein